MNVVPLLRLMGCRFSSTERTDTIKVDPDDPDHSDDYCRTTTTATVVGPTGKTMTASATEEIYSGYESNEESEGDFGDDCFDIALEIHDLIGRGVIAGDELIQ